MTRRFLDDIRSDLNTLLVTGGETTANELRPLMIDMIDSTIQDEAILSGDVITSTSSTPTITAIPVAVYEDESGDDGDFLNTDLAAGTITTSSTAGFTYEASGYISFEDLGTGDRINFWVLRNGLPVGAPSYTSGEGNGDPVQAVVRAYISAATASDVFEIGVETPNGNETFDILAVALFLTIQPTNNP